MSIGYYSVVRLLPSSLAEEFVNVAVLTYGDGTVYKRVIEGAAHARAVAFAGEFDESLQSVLSEMRSEAIIRHAATHWMGCLQITQPRSSTLAPEELLKRIAKTFLGGRV